MKFTNQMNELKNLIRGIVIKNQDEAHRRAAKYYLMPKYGQYGLEFCQTSLTARSVAPCILAESNQKVSLQRENRFG